MPAMPATGPATRQYLLRLANGTPEEYAVRHLGPALVRLEASCAIGPWYFERGADTWTLVCESAPLPGFANEDPEREVLDLCLAAGMIAGWTPTAYRPYTYCAGGTAGLPAARRWRHLDSRQVLTYLRVDRVADRRDDLFVVHGEAAMAGAGLDRQGIAATWGQIASTAPGGLWPAVPDDLVHTVGALLPTTADAQAALDCEPPLPDAWTVVHADYGRALADLHEQGLLWGGRHTVLAAQLLGHADRLGVADPARLAAAAATAALGLTARTGALR
ncbi:hypothetical protein [Kitasatospora sp. NPDC088783]|uniref:hypothetical protein n=1 Tax=Kitasatospora sp. NPDC088783 TaxID=3364077 RepID=UPI00381AB03E